MDIKSVASFFGYTAGVSWISDSLEKESDHFFQLIVFIRFDFHLEVGKNALFDIDKVVILASFA
jgi:hypothetical protein